LHLLQNFVPSNLNRNDTNAPKDCTFGGYRRARISSQCSKRSIRHHDAFKSTVIEAGGNLGTRTKRIAKELVNQLIAKGRVAEEAARVTETLLSSVKIAFDKKKGANDEESKTFKTEYLLYLSQSEIDALAQLADEYWDKLAEIVVTEEDGADKKAKKKAAAKAVPREIQKAVADILRKQPRLAADIALFGRMVADDKDMNIDAACQVAHAISTNEVNMEMDFFTAVDDLLPSEESGSDMMGIVEFNSSCYYRYAQINLGILDRNLSGDRAIAIAAVKGFVQAAVESTPSGMQNSTAHHNMPDYVRVTVRNTGTPWSLANAFIKPVQPKRSGDDLMSASIKQLEQYHGKLVNAYGDAGFELDLKVDLNGITEGGTSLPQLLQEVGNKLHNGWRQE
jgi:CRISPR system Cascade subunit CasC